MESMGINVETIDEKGIESRLGGAGFVGGIKYKDDASVHPIRMLHKISERIEQAKSKVELIENAEVFAIESVNGNKLVKTNKTYIEAPMVVFATNGYSPLLNDFFKDKIFPTRGQILATEPVERFMEGALVTPTSF